MSTESRWSNSLVQLYSKGDTYFLLLKSFFVLDVVLVIELTCYLKAMENFAPPTLLRSNEREDSFLSLIHADSVQ